MATQFKIGVDWRRKGYICWEAQPGDALNLLATPVTYSRWDASVSGDGAVSVIESLSSFSTRIFQVQSGTDTDGGLTLAVRQGGAGDTVGQIDPSTQYTVAVRVRSVNNTVPFTLKAIGDVSGDLASTNITALTADWTTYSVTFTTGASDEYIDIAFIKNNDATDVAFDLGGLMLVAGSSAPIGYNAGSTLDLYDNITSRVMRADWFLGFQQPYQDTPHASILKLKLTNDDQRFSPENTSSVLAGAVEPLRAVCVQSDDGTTTRTHWMGWLESINPQPNPYGERIVNIKASGAERFLSDVQTNIELQENKRTDEIVSRLLREVPVAVPLAESAILSYLGSNLDEVVLTDPTIDSSVETGLTTLGFAADNWVKTSRNSDDTNNQFNVYRAIKDTVAAERGRFYFDREGEAIFWNRHHLLLDDSSPTTLSDDITDLQYTYAGAGEFANDIRVTCHPRRLGSSDSLLYRWDYEEQNATQGIVVNPNQERTININYTYRANIVDGEDITATGESVGARNVYLANVRWADGLQINNGEWSGPINVQDGIISIDTNANSATVRISGGSRYVHLLTFEVRGQPIIDDGQMEAMAKDGTSITENGKRSFALSIPAIEELSTAENIADYELIRRRNPSGKVSAVTVVSHGIYGGEHHAEQLALTIGDKVTIQEAQVVHDKTYVIIGEAHKLTDSATKLETTWYLESLVEANWAILRPDTQEENPILLDGDGVNAPAEPFVLAY